MSYKFIIIHTYGLGDAVMASESIIGVSRFCKENEVDFTLIVQENSAYDFFESKGISCLNGGPKTFLKEVFKSRIKGKNIISSRTAAGTQWKNRLIKNFLNIFRIYFFYEKDLKPIKTNLINYRQAQNNRIGEKLINFFLKKSNISNIDSRDFISSNNMKKTKKIHTYIGLPELEYIKTTDPIRKIFFHFGSGDVLAKSLQQKDIQAIISLYMRAFKRSTFSYICGPRDNFVEISDSTKLEIIGPNNPKTIKELIEIGTAQDIIICNDTGIGHLFSAQGAKVTLVVNKGNKATMQNILPPTIENIILL